MATLFISDILDDLAAAADVARTSVANASPRWSNAVETAYDWLLQQDTIEYDMQASELAAPSASEPGRVHFANGSCTCTAYATHQACWHRSAARLVRRALERRARRIYEEVAELYA